MKFDEKKLLVATHNPGKIAEFRALLSPRGFEILSAEDFRLIEPAETGTTFEENAAIKSETASRASGIMALSDDSGLCVPALNNAPGVYSADWAGHPRDFGKAMRRLEQEMQGKKDRRAFFVCVLALSAPNQKTKFFRGEEWGTLIWPPRGSGGFGFDPMFVPDGHDKTFAELPVEVKNKSSHRAKAVAAFMDYITT